MDLDGDGLTDILSGCYSHKDGSRDLVGEFYVFPGTTEGFGKPQRLRGADGELLVIRPRDGSDYAELERMCTRPTAVDVNGDGRVDIVSGNDTGFFAVFLGTPKGFHPVSSWLVGPDGEPLKVAGHSDPHFADWDGDGDLDLLSGAERGGVSWFPNLGTDAAPRYGEARQLVAPPPRTSSPDEILLGDAHIKGPQIATRVTTADVDGDGKLDLLVGDALDIVRPAEGLSEDECRKRLIQWNATLREIKGTQPEIADHANKTAEEEVAMEAFYKRRDAHWDKRPGIIDRRTTGYVWWLRRK